MKNWIGFALLTAVTTAHAVEFENHHIAVTYTPINNSVPSSPHSKTWECSLSISDGQAAPLQAEVEDESPESLELPNIQTRKSVVKNRRLPLASESNFVVTQACVSRYRKTVYSRVGGKRKSRRVTKRDHAQVNWSCPWPSDLKSLEKRELSCQTTEQTTTGINGFLKNGSMKVAITKWENYFQFAASNCVEKSSELSSVFEFSVVLPKKPGDDRYMLKFGFGGQAFEFTNSTGDFWGHVEYCQPVVQTCNDLWVQGMELDNTAVDYAWSEKANYKICRGVEVPVNLTRASTKESTEFKIRRVR